MSKPVGCLFYGGLAMGALFFVLMNLISRSHPIPLHVHAEVGYPLCHALYPASGRIADTNWFAFAFNFGLLGMAVLLAAAIKERYCWKRTALAFAVAVLLLSLIYWQAQSNRLRQPEAFQQLDSVHASTAARDCFARCVWTGKVSLDRPTLVAIQ